MNLKIKSFFTQITQSFKKTKEEIVIYDEAKEKKQNYKLLSFKGWTLKIILFIFSTFGYFLFKCGLALSIEEVGTKVPISTNHETTHMNWVLPDIDQKIIIAIIVFLAISALLTFSYELIQKHKKPNEIKKVQLAQSVLPKEEIKSETNKKKYLNSAL